MLKSFTARQYEKYIKTSIVKQQLIKTNFDNTNLFAS